jgi:hypothetical protein
MVVAPIGSYFLTVDTIFRGQLPFVLSSAELMTSRQLYVCRRLGSNHGECGLDRICNCGFSGGSKRCFRSRGKGEERIKEGYLVVFCRMLLSVSV